MVINIELITLGEIFTIVNNGGPQFPFILVFLIEELERS